MAKKPAKKPPVKAKAKVEAKKAPAKAKAPAPKKEEKPIKKVRVASRPKNATSLSYNQSEFLENVRAFCGLTKRSQAKEVTEDIAAFVKDALKKGYKIPLMGLGKIYVRKTKPRMGRNPATGEIIHIASKKRVRFTAAKALKEAVLV